MTLSLYDLTDEVIRNEAIALSEFAPGNLMYYRGNRYRITFAKPKTEKRKPIQEMLIICDNCSTVITGERAVTSSAYLKCGKPFTSLHPRNAMRIPDMLAKKINRITSDEEERRRSGYDLSTHYEIGQVNSQS